MTGTSNTHEDEWVEITPICTNLTVYAIDKRDSPYDARVTHCHCATCGHSLRWSAPCIEDHFLNQKVPTRPGHQRLMTGRDADQVRTLLDVAQVRTLLDVANANPRQTYSTTVDLDLEF